MGWVSAISTPLAGVFCTISIALWMATRKWENGKPTMKIRNWNVPKVTSIPSYFLNLGNMVLKAFHYTCIPISAVLGTVALESSFIHYRVDEYIFDPTPGTRRALNRHRMNPNNA